MNDPLNVKHLMYLLKACHRSNIKKKDERNKETENKKLHYDVTIKLRAIKSQHELEWQNTFICTDTKQCQWTKYTHR